MEYHQKKFHKAKGNEEFVLEKIKVLLIDDDIDFIFLIKKIIDKENDIEFCNYAQNKYEGVEQAKEILPDIALIDLNLSNNELDGIEVAKQIRLYTNAKVILLTSFENPQIVIHASKKSFASGYVFKRNCQSLPNIIRETVFLHTPQNQFIRELILQDLSFAERSILNLILGNNINLQSSNKTIANQKTNIFKKLELKNMNEIIHIFSNW